MFFYPLYRCFRSLHVQTLPCLLKTGYALCRRKALYALLLQFVPRLTAVPLPEVYRWRNVS